MVWLSYHRLFTNKDYVVLALSSSLFGFSYYFFTWYIPILIMKLYGPSSLSIMYIVGSIAGVLVVFGGLLSDVFGYKIPIVLVPTVLLLSYALLALSTDFRSLTFAIIVLKLVPLASPATFALLSRLVQREVLGSAFSFYRFLMLVGFGSSSLVMSFISQYISYKLSLIIAVACLLITAILRALIRVETSNSSDKYIQGERKSLKLLGEVVFNVLRPPRTILKISTLNVTTVLAIAVLQALSISFSPYFYNFMRFVVGLNIAFLGIYQTLSTLINALSQAVAGPIVDKYSASRCFNYFLIIESCIMCLITLLAYTHVTTLVVVAILLTSNLLGAVISTSISVIIVKVSPERYRATVYGSITTLASLIAIPLYPIFSAIWGLNPTLIPASYGISILVVLCSVALVRELVIAKPKVSHSEVVKT